MSCEGCPLAGETQVSYIHSPAANVLIVGESPGREELLAGKPFVGRSGQLLEKNLLQVGLSRESVNIANAAKCLIPKDKLTLKQINQVLTCCRPYLEEFTHSVDPKMIVCLGDISLRQVMKMKGISKHRGSVLMSQEFNALVLPTFHPAYILRNNTMEHVFRQDLMSIRAYKENDYKPLDSDLKTEMVEDVVIPEGITAIAIDTETQGLDWMSANCPLVSYSYSYDGITGYQVMIHEEVEGEGDFTITQIRKVGNKKTVTAVNVKKSSNFQAKLFALKFILESPTIKKYMMNGNYDLHHIESLFKQYNMDLPKVQSYVMDVQAAAHLLDENLFIRGSLEQLRKSYTTVASNYSLDFEVNFPKDDMLSVGKDSLSYYAGMDAIVTYQAGQAIRTQLLNHKFKNKLTNYFTRFVMPTITKSLLTLERNGVLLDIPKLANAKSDIATLVQESHDNAIALIPPKVLFTEDKALSLTRAELVRKTLFSKEGFNIPSVKMTEKGDNNSVDKEVRNELLSRNLNTKALDFLKYYSEWADNNVLLSRYLPMFSKLVKQDSRLHPQYSIVSTVTGRSSCAGPSFQNLPRRGPVSSSIRRLIIAPEGHKLLALDYSQSEIRLLGHCSNDNIIVDIYNKGGDIHARTAEAILGKSRDEVDPADFKAARQSAKCINFSLIYGASTNGFKRNAKINYGLDLTYEQADAYRNMWFNTYSNVKKYHKDTINFCRKYGYVMSPLGRMRRLPDINNTDHALAGRAERQALNHAIQSFSSDLVFLSLNKLITEGLVDNEDCRPIAMIHDELLFEVKEDFVDKYYRIIKNVMENPPLKEFGVELLVPMVAEGKAGDNFIDMEAL